MGPVAFEVPLRHPAAMSNRYQDKILLLIHSRNIYSVPGIYQSFFQEIGIHQGTNAQRAMPLWSSHSNEKK